MKLKYVTLKVPSNEILPIGKLC